MQSKNLGGVKPNVRILAEKLDRLVKECGITAGELLVRMHNGTASKIEGRACVVLPQNPALPSKTRISELNSLAAQQYVLMQLEPLILQEIGPFGHARAVVQKGHVVGLDLCRSYKFN